MTEAPRLKYHDEAIIVGAVLDYSGLVDMDDPQYIFDRTYDRHPTAATHARVAENLVEDLDLTRTPDESVANP